ncbi:DUF86 domain-containing protein [soil metagenome]
MSRRSDQRLRDIVTAVDAIDSHTTRGGLEDGLVFDAVRVRLIEIGEAVKGIPASRLAGEAGLPWSSIARMRDVLTHHYFDTAHSIVQHTIDHDLPDLRAAVLRLLAQDA